MSTTAISPVVASTKVLQLLQRLHALSSEQEKAFSEKWTQEYFQKEEWPTVADEHMRDKFVALDADKCQFIYLLARSMGVCNAVEAGTSFGVSTMYLALAVGQNVRQKKRVSSTGQQQSSTLGLGGKVIATEKEESKAARARLYWKEAGEEIEPWIELREGDLLKTLKVEDDMPQEIDLLLLDIWTPLALPTLKIVEPRLRHGAVVVADNTAKARPRYEELLEYMSPQNGFHSLTLPFDGGLELSVYLPEE